MDVWILRYPEPRSRPGAAWKMIILQRTADGEESEIDAIEIEARSPTLEEIVTHQLDRGRTRLVLDLSHVKHLDSSDLAQVLAAFKQVTEQNGALGIANPNPRIREILRITRMEEVLPLFESVEEAAEQQLAGG